MAFLTVKHPHTRPDGERLNAATTFEVADHEVAVALKRRSGAGIQLYFWNPARNNGASVEEFLAAREAASASDYVQRAASFANDAIKPLTAEQIAAQEKLQLDSEEGAKAAAKYFADAQAEKDARAARVKAEAEAKAAEEKPKAEEKAEAKPKAKSK